MKRLGSTHRSTLAFGVVVLVLAGTSAYLFSANASLEARVNSLQLSCRAFYSKLGESLIMIYSTIVYATDKLRLQIQNDTSIISMLNSTRPAGYAKAIDILNSQIEQDHAMISALENAVPITNGLSGIATDPCA